MIKTSPVQRVHQHMRIPYELVKWCSDQLDRAFHVSIGMSTRRSDPTDQRIFEFSLAARMRAGIHTPRAMRRPMHRRSTCKLH